MKCFLILSAVLLAFTALTDGAQPCATFCPAIYMPVCCTNDGKNITFGNNCEAGRYECMNRGTHLTNCGPCGPSI